MRNQIILSIVILSSLLLAATMAQWQVNPEVQPRNEPVYPPKPYSFQSAPPGYDPFQFNWYSGRWDYVPIPYENGQSPYPINPYSGQWNYVPQPAPASGAAAPQSAAPSAPTNGALKIVPPATPPLTVTTTQPSDARLWASPTSQPVGESPRTVSFQGRLVGIRAINLRGSPQPELLLRLRDRNGKAATIAVGQRLHIPNSYPVSDGLEIAGVGKAGEIDSAPVVFADQITINSKPAPIERGE
jgi:hypothetical protein